MKAHSMCKQCFLKQAAYAAKLIGADEFQQNNVLEILEKEYANLPQESSPPEIARYVYKLISEILDYHGDIYAEIKDKSNKLALSIYDDLKNKVVNAENRLLIAAELAIVGNVIDYGAKSFLDVDKEIEKILSDRDYFKTKDKKKLFNYLEFEDAINNAQTILYLADNAGETVFDRVLIEQMKNINTKLEIIYAVKEQPIINDATIKDAYECGINNIAKVISSGSDAPGTVLPLCFKEFKRIFNQADIVISKGQGNFEALSDDSGRPIFFLFMIKCPVVAEVVNGDIGDIVLSCKYGTI